ncbi:glucokinase [Reinekea blandensis]|uniref:Glucokinase n=1 Tax=Reinekea blandensis MED297 TaxID=314283 RepID=A4BGM8_9GAMM|nr:glucokinase [Reinekea blandensis]EAR08676.1 glucokinase [Reinekea sp. MED297] [Reinekea blandensis MED297]
MEQLGLIADIGGTNARFALTPIRTIAPGEALKLTEADLIAPTALNGAEYANIADAIEAYLAGPAADYPRPEHSVMAIACPTDQDQITMTNHTWSFKVSELKATLGFKTLTFINDYNALANAIPQLDDDGLIKIGRGEPVVGMPIAVTGPGTGLGLAALAFNDNEPVTLETEGGHAHFAPTDETEIGILQYLLTKHDRVSNERLISGMGLENIYRALSSMAGEEKALSAPEISKAALDGSDELCGAALARFCAILGSYAGDVALTLGAKGGVFITGGIVPRFIEYFKSSEFRARFEDKARLAGFVQLIPTYVVVSQQPGLLGSAAVLNHRLNH